MGWGNESPKLIEIKRHRIEEQRLAAERNTAVQRADHAEAAVARVRAVLDHAAKVSPSASMTVYAAEIRNALNGTP